MERTEWAKRVRARAEELAKQHKEITAATEEVTVELAAAFPSVTDRKSTRLNSSHH